MMMMRVAQSNISLEATPNGWFFNDF